MAQRGVRQSPGAENVVANDGDGVGLHQRHMLERSGMENRAGAVFFQKFVEQSFVGNVAENGNVDQ